MAAIVLETSTATPVWAAYKSGEGMFDEMLDLANSERNGCQPTAKALFSMPPDWFAEISGRAQQMFRRMGVTFNVYGGADGVERIFPFDPIPRVIDADTWATLEAGLIQRVRALNMFVGDVYGEGNILADGIVPRDLVLG